MLNIRIVGCKIENLRGYDTTSCRFGNFTVLIGENNEGKSSVLKMIDFLVNQADFEFLSGSRRLTAAEERFWMPANDAHHRARRLTLFVEISDGRVARKYNAKAEEAINLRMGIKKSTMRAQLNLGSPMRNERHDPNAMDLLDLIKKHLDVVLIPAVRDVDSSRFAQSLAAQVDETIGRKLDQRQRGGRFSEYRNAKKTIETLQQIVSCNKQGLSIGNGLPILDRMLRDSEVRFEAQVNDIMGWIKQGLSLAISTGDHDSLMVRATEVGNGLQSIIDISLIIAAHETDDSNQLFLVVEEPEAFLHPAAQRELIIGLQQSVEDKGRQIVVTSHSPIVIDETEFQQTALVRNHHFYDPTCSNKRRDSINTSLMSVSNSETFFAGGVLLVEGPGDKAFFEGLLRRLRRLRSGMGLSRLVSIQA